MISLELFTSLEMQLCLYLRRGLYVDPQKLAQQSAQLAEDVRSALQAFTRYAGEDFQLGFSSQLSHILFDVLKLPTYGLKKTRTGFAPAMQGSGAGAGISDCC